MTLASNTTLIVVLVVIAVIVIGALVLPGAARNRPRAKKLEDLPRGRQASISLRRGAEHAGAPERSIALALAGFGEQADRAGKEQEADAGPPGERARLSTRTSTNPRF